MDRRIHADKVSRLRLSALTFALLVALVGAASPSHATVSVFDVSGRRVAVLADRQFGAGTNAVSWDGSSDGSPLPSGVYFVELRANGERAVRKVSLRK